MPPQRFKSRVRFLRPGEKQEPNDRGKGQRGLLPSESNGGPRSPLFSNMAGETLFQKKHVPSVHELGDLLQSNLSSSLAADNNNLQQQSAQYSLPPVTSRYTNQLQEEYDDPPASLLQLAPLIYATRDHLEPAGGVNPVNEAQSTSHGASTPLLSTTVLYAPYAHREEKVPVPPSDHVRVIKGVQIHIPSTTEDDEDDAALPESSTKPILIQKHRSTFLEDEGSTFAGCFQDRIREENAHEQNACLYESSTTPLSSPPQPSVRSPSCSVYSKDEAFAHSASSSRVRPSSSQRQPLQFARAKNLPVSPPILVPKQQRPYQPVAERFDQPFIQPANDHRLFGTYYVAPDIFSPEEVQVGFPGSSSNKNSPMRQPHNDARFLDRNNTAWGKWYAKHPNPEDLAFAADHKGAAELTEQEVWDMHAAAHAKFRKSPPPPTSEEELAQKLDDEEHERAGRLRYHTGHCFDAILGYCYPFQDEHII